MYDDERWVSLTALASELAKRVGDVTARRQLIACLIKGKAVAFADRFDVHLSLPDGSIPNLDGYPISDFEICPEFWQFEMAEDRSHDRPTDNMPKRLERSRSWLPASHWGAWHQNQPPIFANVENICSFDLRTRQGFEQLPDFGWANIKIENVATGVFIPRNQADDILSRKDRETLVKNAEALRSAIPQNRERRGQERDEIFAKFLVHVIVGKVSAQDAIQSKNAEAMLNNIARSRTHKREWKSLAAAIEKEWQSNWSGLP